MGNRSLWIRSGVAGMACIACYLLGIFINWPDTQLGTSTGLLVITGFPVLGIIFSYGLYDFLAAENDGAANRLGFVFWALAFTTLLGMIYAQAAVGAGIGEMTKGVDAATAKAVRRGLRLIDMGLDVAWDMLGATALIFWGVAMRRRSGLGLGWSIPTVAFGVALIVLNAATFPWPPADRGLFDIGPFVGVFVFALAVRLTILGRRAASQP